MPSKTFAARLSACSRTPTSTFEDGADRIGLATIHHELQPALHEGVGFTLDHRLEA
jgi:hypothetical protein